MSTHRAPRGPRAALRSWIRRTALPVVVAVALAACAGAADDDAAAPTDEGSAPAVDEPADDDATGASDEDADDTASEADGDDPSVSLACTEEQPDCDDTIEVGGGDDGADSGAAGGGAAGSCLVGDEDCVDESYSGQDVARAVPVTSDELVGEDAPTGLTVDATGARIEGAAVLDDTTLQLAFSADPCTLVQDVVLTENDEEVRVLLLTGSDPRADACTQQVVEYVTTVELTDPLGDRTVLDLSGGPDPAE